MNKFVLVELDEKLLASETLRYIYSIKDTYLESTLFLKILNPIEEYSDIREHENFVSERLSKLEFSIDFDSVTYENKVSGFTDGTPAQGRLFSKKMFEKENFSKEIFWAGTVESQQYKAISKFDCFIDKVVPEEKLHTALINAPYFNIDGWLDYYQDLLDLKFPQFSEKIISGKSIIKYKPFKGEYFLGIETDYQSCRSSLRKGRWQEPNYSLLIFKKVTDKKIQKVITFQKFVHPYFDPPAYSF
jgi:hypothetical protein